MLGCPADAAKHLRSERCPHRKLTVRGRDDAEVVYITVEGLGHTWAGGKSLLPEFMVGKLSDKIRATDVIWEFFRETPQEGKSVNTRPTNKDCAKPQSYPFGWTSPRGSGRLF